MITIPFTNYEDEGFFTKPRFANEGDAGADLTATYVDINLEKNIVVCDTNIAVAIPSGHVGLLVARSSIWKRHLMLANNVGIIDSGYRGPLKLIFHILDREHFVTPKTGERIGQLLIFQLPPVEYKKVDQLDTNTSRGVGGFGSTGI